MIPCENSREQEHFVVLVVLLVASLEENPLRDGNLGIKVNAG